MAAGQLGLVDLSTFPRTGFKGAGTPAWAQARGVVLPAAPNLARPQSCGSLVARLSDSELLILAGRAGDHGDEQPLPVRLAGAWSLDSADRTYLLLRQHSHAWFALTGRCASEAMSKVCGVDLHPARFDDARVAQTSVARVNAIVIRQDLNGGYGLHLLSDISSAGYLWMALLDAMEEFGGRAVGVDALQAPGVSLRKPPA
jgi:sarcosine oxidase subunit gamma